MRSAPNQLTSSTRKSGTARVYVYLATTQTGWLVCVMTAASHHAAWGVTYALIATAGHLLFARRPASEARIFDTLEMPWIADLSAMKCSTLHPLRGSTRISDCFQPRRQFYGVLK